MERKEKVVILLLIIITIALVVVGAKIKNDNKKEETTLASAEEEEKVEEEEEISEVDLETLYENVAILEDGTKLNTSEKLQETKTCEGLELSNIQLTEKENKSKVMGQIKNTSNEDAPVREITLKFYKENGDEIITITGIVNELSAGETTNFYTEALFDFSMAYDFSISI